MTLPSRCTSQFLFSALETLYVYSAVWFFWCLDDQRCFHQNFISELNIRHLRLSLNISGLDDGVKCWAPASRRPSLIWCDFTALDKRRQTEKASVTLFFVACFHSFTCNVLCTVSFLDLNRCCFTVLVTMPSVDIYSSNTLIIDFAF